MKILGITTIRSDYDALSSLYKLLNSDENIELKILVAGAHLSKKYGYTIENIKKDGLEVLAEIESLIDSDSKQSRIKSAAILMQSSIELILSYNPDLIIYCGDREDTLVMAMIGGYLGIPTLHIYGGDHTEDGYIDNPVRHAVTKMSTIHFTSTIEHKNRILKMGEKAERIHQIGSIALDRFKEKNYLSKKELFLNLSIEKEDMDFAIVLFHPLSNELKNSSRYFENILLALKKRNLKGIVIYPNVDPGNYEIIKVIEKYKNDEDFYFYENLGQKNFISAYKYCKFIIGNSSSGIIEAASIPVPAINVGLRQLGRYSEMNVKFSSGEFDDILANIDEVLSDKFLQQIKNMTNPYGNGESAKEALNLIKTIDFKKYLLKKEDPLKS